jgi:ABC-2 type transport system ATP-binding protein
VVTAYLESVRDDRRAQEHASGQLVSPEEAEGGWHVHAVHLVDATGRDVDVVDSGAGLTIRLEIEVAPGEDVALAVGLYRTDGVHVAGPVYLFHTGGGGRKTIDYRVPSLPLTAGTYDVSARLLDSHLARTHAVRRRAARLDVNSDSAADIGGVLAMGGRWTVTDRR